MSTTHIHLGMSGVIPLVRLYSVITWAGTNCTEEATSSPWTTVVCYPQHHCTDVIFIWRWMKLGINFANIFRNLWVLHKIYCFTNATSMMVKTLALCFYFRVHNVTPLQKIALNPRLNLKFIAPQQSRILLPQNNSFYNTVHLLRYNPKGGEFVSRCSHWDVSLT